MKGMQFKIVLQDTEPPVWRRIIVPEKYSFWDLHVAIQDSFGWFDSHLHAFVLNRSIHIGIPDDDGMDDFLETKPGWKIKIKMHFDKVGKKIIYEYDFGDGWEHEVKFEKFVDEEIKKPLCIGGERACPPEDCGGIGGYEDFCKIMIEKKGEEYKEMKEWYGEDYDPEYFDPNKVEFDNPKSRLKMLQGI